MEPAHWEVMKQNDEKWCALIKISNHHVYGFQKAAAITWQAILALCA